MVDRTLPDGWEWTALNEIGEVVTGTTPSKANINYYGNDFPFFKPTDLDVGFHTVKARDGLSKLGMEKARLLPAKSVLVTCIGATIGKTGMIRVSGASNQQINAIIPYQTIVPEYLYYVCVSPTFQKSILDNASATTLPILNKGKFEQLLVPLAPLSEQERIVNRIEELFSDLDAGVASLERVCVGMRRYKTSVLKAACEGNLFERREVKSIGELPEGWSWKSASEFCIAVESGSTPKAEFMTSGEGEVPFIKVYNLTFDGALDFTVRPTFISKETHNTKLKRSRVYPGDLLTNIVGPPLGKVSIVPNTYPEWNMNQAVVLFRTGNTVDNKYLSIVLQSPDFLKRMKATSKATAGQHNVSLTTCRNIPMPIPPLDEQRRIVAEVERRLSVISEVESAVEAGLDRAGRLRQSVLRSAFEGRL